MIFSFRGTKVVTGYVSGQITADNYLPYREILIYVNSVTAGYSVSYTNSSGQ